MSRFDNMSLDGNASTTTNQQSQTTANKTTGTEQGTTRPTALGSFGRTLGRNQHSESVLKLHNGLLKVIENEDEFIKQGFKDGRYAYIPFNGQDNASPISGVIAVRREENIVCAIFLGLESTVTELPDKPLKDYGVKHPEFQNLMIPLTPGDLVIQSDHVQNKIGATILQRYPDYQPVLIGVTVIESIVNLDDPAVIGEIAYRCNDQLEGYLADAGIKFEGFDNTLNIPAFMRLGNRFSLRVKHPHEYKPEVTGQIVRDDISVSVIRSEPSAQGQMIPSVVTHSFVRGFMDFVYKGPNLPANGVFGPYDRGVYKPVLVITDIDTGAKASTISQVVMGIISTVSLASNRQWMSTFTLPNLEKRPENNIGVLGRDVPLKGTSAYDTDDSGKNKVGAVALDSSFDPIEFLDVAVLTKDEFDLYIDIPDVGKSSSLLNTITMAANGNTEANLVVVNSLDELFDGKFLQIWEQAGKPMLFNSVGTRIPLGYYANNRGERMPLSMLDVVRAYEYIKDWQRIDEVTNCLYGQDQLPEVRLGQLVQFVRALLPNAVINGYASRVAVSDLFFGLVGQAMMVSGVNIEPDQSAVVYAAQSRGAIRTFGTSAHGTNYGFQNRQSTQYNSTGYAGWTPRQYR